MFFEQKIWCWILNTIPGSILVKAIKNDSLIDFDLTR